VVVKHSLQKCVLKADLNVSKLAGSRMAAGMLFLTAGAETAKEWLSHERHMTLLVTFLVEFYQSDICRFRAY